MNVLLLHLPLARNSYFYRYSREEPLLHLYLAPVLSPAHKLRLIDLRLTPNLQKELGEFRPDAAVVGVETTSIPVLGKTLESLRALFPKLRILLVPEAAYGNSQALERPLDFAHPLAEGISAGFFLRYSQELALEAISAWERGEDLSNVPGLWFQQQPGRWAPSSPRSHAMRAIGAADRRLLGRYRGQYRFAGLGRMAHLFYTYGCKFKCRFCPMSKHDGTIQTRPLSEVVQELEEMSEPNVFLQDYEPFLAPEAMHELARALEITGIRKNFYMLTRADTALRERALIERWKKLGLRWLYLGLDGETPERLREIQKANTVETNEAAVREMEELGLLVTVGFVVRSDYGLDDFARLREYVKTLRPPAVGFSVETPVLGSKLFDETQEQQTTRDWSLFDLGHAVLPTKLSLDRFYHELFRLQLFGMRQSGSAFLRHYPLRDSLHNALQTPGALWGIWHGARDHNEPRQDSFPQAALA